jgi:hypothetical protein
MPYCDVAIKMRVLGFSSGVGGLMKTTRLLGFYGTGLQMVADCFTM